MPEPDVFGENRLKRLRLYFYLVPIVGFFPALWQLYRRQGDRQEQQTCRSAILLMLLWLISYGSLGFGASQSGEILAFRLQFLNAIATSGYVLTCFFLMLQVWRQTPPKIPLISQLAKQLGKKYFS